MDYFTPGFREVSRKVSRQLIRLRIAAERRKLGKAEAELGLLGWQQADFDPDTQREVDKIQNYEREQSRLTNEGAECGRVIRELQDKRELARRAFEESRQRLWSERMIYAEASGRLQKQLQTYRKQEPEYERRIPELDRELREVQSAYTQLLAAERQTQQVRENLGRLKERTVAIPNEKAELRTKHMHVASEIKSLEGQSALKNESLAKVDREIHELESAFEAADREVATEIRISEREKARIDKENDALERAKNNPYQQIGRVLADHSLAPMNQPHALEKVYRYRESVEHLQSKISSSLAITAQADVALVRISYLIWSSIFLAISLVLAAFLVSSN